MQRGQYLEQYEHNQSIFSTHAARDKNLRKKVHAFWASMNDYDMFIYDTQNVNTNNLTH